MTNDLLADIEQFLTKKGVHPTCFGRAALNDPNFVFDLRRGRDYRRSTAERVKKYIDDNAEVK